jgi:hypothetical protein
MKLMLDLTDEEFAALTYSLGYTSASIEMKDVTERKHAPKISAIAAVHEKIHTALDKDGDYVYQCDHHIGALER